jgi:hypothetical protein
LDRTAEPEIHPAKHYGVKEINFQVYPKLLGQLKTRILEPHRAISRPDSREIINNQNKEFFSIFKQYSMVTSGA